MTALGHHLLAEFSGCDAASLADLELVTTAMLQAATASGATIVTHSFHHFSPHGVSGAVIIAESHLAIHTWPEHGFRRRGLLHLRPCRHGAGSGCIEEGLRCHWRDAAGVGARPPAGS